MNTLKNLFVSVTLGLTLVACGGGGTPIVIEGNDQMKFSVESFTVKSGEAVNLTLKNVGKLPKESMGHNLVILKPGVKAVEFAAQVLVKGGTPANEYLPEAVKGDVLHYTKLLGPGESASLKFTAPAPGEYEYVCTFPAHAAFMKGVMKVE